ncbi:MAG TPA: ribonuclease P protein component [Puia sp.]|nr:ribonuclease P protein component [Puia sp.]
MARQFTLGKTERLKSRKIIEQLFDAGKNFSVSPYQVFYLFIDGRIVLQAGFTVSSKHFRKAVDRNRIKRITREAYRLQKQSLYNRLYKNKQQLVVFFIYTAKELQPYSVVSDKMSVILQKLLRIADENNTSNT